MIVLLTNIREGGDECESACECVSECVSECVCMCIGFSLDERVSSVCWM